MACIGLKKGQVFTENQLANSQQEFRRISLVLCQVLLA